MSALASNPSHLLLSRNPRSPAHPQLAPTWTSRHPPTPANLGWGSSADDIGHARAYSVPLPPLDNATGEYEDYPGSPEIEEEVVDVHPTFRKDAALPGRIKVIVGRYEFWCHKEVLWFTCPFFQDVLQGSWAETNQTHNHTYESSLSPHPSHRNSFIAESAIAETDTALDRYDQSALLPSLQEDSIPVHDSPVGGHSGLYPAEAEEGEEEEGIVNDPHTKSVYLDAVEDGLSVAEILKELRELPDLPNSDQALHILDPDAGRVEAEIPILGEVALPIPTSSFAVNQQHLGPPPLHSSHDTSTPISPRPPLSPAQAPRRRSSTRQSFSSGIRAPSLSRLRASAGRSRDLDDGIDAVVQLHEESALAFQDFLFWAYPHLECKVTWTNVENLLALAYKLIVPALQKMCEHFLLTHASGRPVMALALAEQHSHAELYKEASRFVLDQPTWNAEEMQDLSEQTQLKLSQRRTWFLERLLKLGSIDVRKEYTCRPECPDPARCQFHLDEKWRQAQSAVCRYGPPQPSMAFKCLRQLETFPTYPSLVMPHPLCQSAAKSWVMLLYDRMFQLKTIASPLIAGTEKYWLFITLH